jgi:hypothetical protein
MHMGFAKELIYWFALPARGLAIFMSVWRKFVSELPVFFAFLIAGELSDLARLAVYYLTGYPKVYKPYYYTYWLTGSILSAMALLASLELCGRLFPGFRRVSFYRRLFPIAAIPILVIGLMAGLTRIMGFPWAVALLKIVFGFDATRIAFLFFFVALMLLMGRTWKGYEFGIALGLSIDAAESMVSSGFFAGYPRIRSIVEVLGPFTDDIASVIWLVSIWSFKKIRAEDDGPLSPDVLQAAERAESAIKDLVTRSDRGK